MKKYFQIVSLLLCALVPLACQSHEQKREKYATRKIYLTQEDYINDLSKSAAAERRETPPNVESEYVFNAKPETEKEVYFFDHRQQPKVPGQPSASDYKKEKRLWTKPKRYSPEQYYGGQEAPAGDSSGGSSSETSYSYDEDY